MPSRTSSLCSLQLRHLKAWAFFTGLPTTGYKAGLADAIYRRMENTSVHERAKQTVVSLDMGIRNLAFCVIDAPPTYEQSLGQRTRIKVRSWVRMDLLKEQGGLEISAQEDREKQIESTESELRKSLVASKGDSKIEKDIFGPEILSRTAYGVTCELMKHNPNAILIERQRFRSGGAASIQEWTVRVNMLESMIWACLETLRSRNQDLNEIFPLVIPMSPSRVANYWLAGRNLSPLVQDDFFSTDPRKPSVSGEEVSSKQVLKKVRNIKEEKVSKVRSWILGESDLSLDFEDGCAHIAEAFRLQNKKAASELAGGKLDDLADCLLQAVTWVCWQQNQHRIEELYEGFRRVSPATGIKP